jgi:hypothetical protein
VSPMTGAPAATSAWTISGVTLTAQGGKDPGQFLYGNRPRAQTFFLRHPKHSRITARFLIPRPKCEYSQHKRHAGICIIPADSLASVPSAWLNMCRRRAKPKTRRRRR